MENNPNQRTINSELIKRSMIPQIKKLVLAIQVEKKCGKDVAVEEVSYFLKQLIFLLTNQK